MELAKPRKYDTAEDLEKKVDQYFAVCEKDDVIPDRANMCLYLGISYDLYNDYENNRDGKYEGFASVLKKAQARREAWLVRWLASGRFDVWSLASGRFDVWSLASGAEPGD